MRSLKDLFTVVGPMHPRTSSVMNPLIWILAIQSTVCVLMQHASGCGWMFATGWFVTSLISVVAYAIFAAFRSELLQSEDHRYRDRLLRMFGDEKGDPLAKGQVWDLLSGEFQKLTRKPKAGSSPAESSTEESS